MLSDSKSENGVRDGTRLVSSKWILILRISGSFFGSLSSLTLVQLNIEYVVTWVSFINLGFLNLTCVSADPQQFVIESPELVEHVGVSFEATTHYMVGSLTLSCFRNYDY